MKTLKKTLCLVLALVMALSLMSVASATNVEKYDDAAEVGAAYVEAVDVLLGLGIVNGMSATEIAPEGYYTRAQAAKIATYLAVGPTVAEMLPAAESFTDVPTTHWASKYIAYCASKNILNGVSATEYAPEAYVTGYQFAKMVLAAAGYGANNEFVGNGWAIATAQWALDAENNLFKGDAKAATNEPITRQQAMLIAFNALKTVDFVAYDKNLDKYVAADGNAVDNDNTFGTEKYSLALIEDVIISTNSANADVETTNGYAVNTGLDMLGHQVNVWYVDADGNGSYTAKEKVAALVDETTKVVTVASTFTADATKWEAAFGKETLTSNVAEAVVADKDAAAGTYFLVDKTIVAYLAPATVTFDKVAAPTTTAGSEAINLVAGGALANNKTSDVVNEYEGIAKDDYVVVTQIGAIYNLQKVTTVEGTISEVGADNAYVVLNGTKYTASAATGTSDVVEAFPASAENYKNNTYVLYLDANGDFITCAVKVDNSTPTSTLYYVTGEYTKTVAAVKDDYNQVVSAGGTAYYVQAVDMAGNIVTLQVEDDAQASIELKNLYTVTVANGTDASNTGLGKCDYATFTPVATAAAAGTKAVAKAETADITEKALNVATATGEGKIYFDDAQVVIYVATNVDLNKTKVVVADAGKLAITNDYVVYGEKADTVNKNYTAKYVIIDGAPATAAAGVASLYIPSDAAAVSSNANGSVYAMYIDGVKTNITVAAAFDAGLKGKFVDYTIDATTGAYTITGAVASGATYSASVVAGDVYGTMIKDIDASGAVIVDLFSTTNAVETLAGIAASAKTFTVSYMLADGEYAFIYITNIA